MGGWNGSGTFTRTYNWTEDQGNGILIRADRHDVNDVDFVNGINNCLTIDGQNIASANLPMGNFRHTGVGNGVAANDYAALGQLQAQAGVWCGTATGTADALILTPSPAITAYAAGQSFVFNASVNPNTTATTVAISGLAAIDIQYNSAACIGGEVLASKWYRITLDTATTCQLEAISTQLPFDDTIPVIRGGTDNTKQVRFEVDGLTTATTRVLTVPDKNGTIATTDDTTAVLESFISGYLLSSISGSSTTATITVGSGQAADSTDAVYITDGSGFSWDVSNGNAINGYQGGTTLPNSDTIHMFVCEGSSGRCSFAHNGLTPTPPSNYDDSFRRVGSFVTNGSGAPIAFTATETGGGYKAVLTVSLSQTQALTSTAATLTLTSIPTDIKVNVHMTTFNNTNPSFSLLSDLSTTDAAPSLTASPGVTSNNGGVNAYTSIEILTNTSGQIRGRSNTNNSATMLIRGWEDFRR